MIKIPRLELLVSTALIFAAVFQAMPANAVDAKPLVIMRPEDAIMDCAALSQEALLMQDIILTTEGIIDDSDTTNMGISAAGAVGSFIVGGLTGGLGFAAAGYVLKEAAGEKGERAEDIQDIAEQRRSLIYGIYNVKGCYGPMEHAMQNPPKEDSILVLSNIEPASGNGMKHKPQYND